MAPSATTITEQYEPTILSLNGNSTNENGYSSPNNGKHLMKDALKKRIESIDTDACEAGEEDAFFVADMGEVYRQHLRWKMNLKRVKPHYGMSVLTTLDCALTNTRQPSNATQILKFFVYSLDSALVLIVHPKQKLSKSSTWALTHPGSSTPSLARPNPTFAMLLSKGLSR